MIIITLPNFSQTSVTQGLNHQAVYGLPPWVSLLKVKLSSAPQPAYQQRVLSRTGHT